MSDQISEALTRNNEDMFDDVSTCLQLLKFEGQPQLLLLFVFCYLVFINYWRSLHHHICNYVFQSQQEDLLAELEGLEDELNLIDEEERAPAIPTKPKKTATPATSAPEVVFDFPSAPQGKLQQPQKQAAVESEDERELRLLQESMLA